MDGIRYRETDQMKDSRIKWIGPIPGDWQVAKLGYYTSMIVPMRDKPDTFNGNIPWIRIEDFVGKYIEESKSNQNVSLRTVKKMNLKIFPVGTVLCTCSCSLGTTAIVRRPLVSNQTFIGVVSGKRTYVEFLYYLLQANAERLQYLSSGAIQQYLSREDFEHLIVQIPSIAEQRQIANFLDIKTTQFDSIIAKKEQLIAKLEEAKRALISEVVTGKVKIVDGQLVPRQPDEMKDSGIEWIHFVPIDWQVTRIKQLAKLISKGTTPSTIGRDLSEDGTVRFLKAENIVNDKIESIPEFYIDEYTDRKLARSRLRDQDLLVVIAGATIGKVAIVSESVLPANTNQAISFIRPKDKDNAGFIYFWLKSDYIQKQIRQIAVQSAQPNLSMEDLGNMVIILPPKSEICAINQFLETDAVVFEKTIKREQDQISLIKSAKQSLISEAVTGKIDLRDWTIIEQEGAS